MSRGRMWVSMSMCMRRLYQTPAYAALATVIETAKLRQHNVFDTLANLMGPPVLPFLVSQNP